MRIIHFQWPFRGVRPTVAHCSASSAGAGCVIAHRGCEPFGDQQRHAAAGEHRAPTPQRVIRPPQSAAEPTCLQRRHAQATQSCAVRSTQPEQQIGQRSLTQPAHCAPGQPGLHRGQHRACMDEWPPVAPQHDFADMATLHAGTAAVLAQHLQLFRCRRCRALAEQLHCEATKAQREPSTQRAVRQQPGPQGAIERQRSHEAGLSRCIRDSRALTQRLPSPRSCRVRSGLVCRARSMRCRPVAPAGRAACPWPRRWTPATAA